jgi:D-xylose transport system permease protein
MIAYLNIPSFIVTLGGLLVWRGAAFLVAGGKTIAPMDDTFALIGGGSFGALGRTGSWIFAAIAVVAVVWGVIRGRKARTLHGFQQRPVWAEWFMGGLICAIILGATAIVNSYIWPKGNIKKYYDQLGLPVPDGAEFGHGYAYPVLILIVVAIFMTVLMTRTRFGRYVFAIGGNPEAAALSGINTRTMTVKIFTLMGALAGIAAVIGSARQNSATNAMGNLDELYVIAAAVVGGNIACWWGGHGLRGYHRRADPDLVADRHGADRLWRWVLPAHRDRHCLGLGRLAGHRLSQAD